MVEIDLLTSYSCKNLLTISVTFKEYFIVYYSNTQDRLLYPLNISVSFECFTINVFQISKVSENITEKFHFFSLKFKQLVWQENMNT